MHGDARGEELELPFDAIVMTYVSTSSAIPVASGSALDRANTRTKNNTNY